MAGLKFGTGIGLFLVVTLALFFAALLFRAPNRAPTWQGHSAQLPCLADSNCPMDQKCTGGFCSEGFIGPVNTGVDMSSCNTRECKGINATCGRKETPCPEGTFCQNDACVNVVAPSQGEAYSQIGMILS
jgi:hypothetical protein